jgi:hypothetical protein
VKRHVTPALDLVHLDPTSFKRAAPNDEMPFLRRPAERHDRRVLDEE